MPWVDFSAPVEAGALAGQVTEEDGPPVLLLHGGPSLACDYLLDLSPELTDGYRLALYQQRSLAPSTTTGPFTVEQHAADVVAVLDTLGWSRAWLVGHSWGGHLALAAATQHPERIAGVVSVDPLGFVGDGGGAALDHELTARISPAAREEVLRLTALLEPADQEPPDTETTAALHADLLRLLWPGYFADPLAAPAMPDTALSVEGFVQTWASILEGMASRAQALAGITCPVVIVHGEASPIPVQASVDTAALIPACAVDVVPGAGHFVWYEAPGAVRSALDRLAGMPA